MPCPYNFGAFLDDCLEIFFILDAVVGDSYFLPLPAGEGRVRGPRRSHRPSSMSETTTGHSNSRIPEHDGVFAGEDDFTGGSSRFHITIRTGAVSRGIVE